jgi:hypothetical protein
MGQKIMDEKQELAGPFVCKHCGNETIFKKAGSYTYRFTDEYRYTGDSEYWVESEWILHKCLTCSQPTLLKLSIDSDEASFYPDGEILYYNRKQLYPIVSDAPDPSSDIPEEIIDDYEEARAVLPYSPRASAALLRLVLQKLCIHLGYTRASLNDNIKALVKERRLSTEIQQALDAVRVIGNNAVHPGEINLNDKPEIALTLFKLINRIVEETITRPRESEDIYNTLPKSTHEQVRSRDKTTESQK